MAGGEGSRLRPLTLNRPKPMVPLVNRPVMGHIVELLKRHGIREIVSTLQYRAEDIQNYFADGAMFDISMNYAIEQAPLGTAGSVKNAQKYLDPHEPFVIISGDALTDINLTEIVEFHKRVGAAVTITLYHVPNPLEYGVIITDATGRIERFLEKPSWGEVISDTVNTGIYVVSPEVLDEFESNVQFDFSKDLFPLLMAKGAPLYGFVGNGYWTDVGNIPEYMRANGDLLAHRVDVGEFGRPVGGEIYIEDDVEIAPDAQLHGPIFLGQGAQIKGGVVIHGPTVIRPFTIIDNRTHIDASLIWRNSYVGENAELRGAILMSRVSVKSRAMIFEGAVIGDDSVIGEGAVVHPNVKVWPNKQVDSGATLRTSLVWGSQARRTLFSRYGASGQVNVDLTPEVAAKLGAAFASILPKGSTVTINRDPHRSPRMIKRAMIAGLPSAGVNVVDIEANPIPVARYYTRVTNAVGGVHVRLSPYDQRVVDIRFFGRDGLNLSKSQERSVENIYFREDVRRAYLDDIGRIDVQPDAASKRYVADFFQKVDVNVVRARKFTIVVDYANAPAAEILPSILDELGVTVIVLNERVDESKMSILHPEFTRTLERLASITGAVRADLGVRVDVGGERIWLVDQTGTQLAGTTAAAAFAELMLRSGGGGALAFYNHQPDVFERIAERYGAQTIRTKIDPQALTQAATQDGVRLAFSGYGEFIVPEFQPAADGLFALAKILELLARANTTLVDIVASLPITHMANQRIECAWERKGVVMRLLNEQYREQIIDQIDGVKLRVAENEWVLISPDPDEPIFQIYAQANTPEGAEEICTRYARIVQGLEG